MINPIIHSRPFNDQKCPQLVLLKTTNSGLVESETKKQQ